MFDTVDHIILFKRLWELGIRGITYTWFVSYLTDYTYCVRTGNHFNHQMLVRNGVFQGSVFGTALFTIYINC